MDLSNYICQPEFTLLEFTVDVAAGVAHALFEVTPGTSKTIHVNIKIGSYEDKEIHAYGYYWPGHNKDNSYPISLTHPFKIRKVCPTLTEAPEGKEDVPGFEAIFVISGLLAVAYLVGRSPLFIFTRRGG